MHITAHLLSMGIIVQLIFASWVEMSIDFASEESLKAVESINTRNTKTRNRRTWAAKVIISGLVLVGVAAMSAGAQRLSPNQGETDGISVGGQWVEFHSEEKMTGAKKVRFEILSDNYLREDPDYKPRIELTCTDGKYTSAEFNPGIRLGPPNRPGFWGQPQMEVMVRVDQSHSNHGWNWRDRFLSMDKGTARELIGARVFKVQIPSHGGPEIAEFSPAGLNLARIKQACDLTPKKPSKD
jgi:hypothetical protein